MKPPQEPCECVSVNKHEVRTEREEMKTSTRGKDAPYSAQASNGFHTLRAYAVALVQENGRAQDESERECRRHRGMGGQIIIMRASYRRNWAGRGLILEFRMAGRILERDSERQVYGLDASGEGCKRKEDCRCDGNEGTEDGEGRIKVKEGSTTDNAVDASRVRPGWARESNGVTTGWCDLAGVCVRQMYMEGAWNRDLGQ